MGNNIHSKKKPETSGTCLWNGLRRIGWGCIFSLLDGLCTGQSMGGFQIKRLLFQLKCILSENSLL